MWSVVFRLNYEEDARETGRLFILDITSLKENEIIISLFPFNLLK
jgi:hypothetical protein